MKKGASALWLLVPILLFTVAGVFARVMTGLDHNEHMYVTAGVLVRQGRQLYRDFAYLQMPYLPLLYGGLYRWLGNGAYNLLASKLVSFLLIGLSAGVLFLHAQRVVHHRWLALNMAILFLLNATVVNSASEVSNYILPVALSMLGFLVFIVSLERVPVHSPGMALAGFLLALAIGTKLTYATLVIPFGIAGLIFGPRGVWMRGSLKDKAAASFLPWLAGLGLGLLPVLYFARDWDVFYFNNLGFHTTTGLWRQLTGFNRPMEVVLKLAYAGYQLFFKVHNLALVLAILAGLGANRPALRPRLKQIPPGLFLAISLALVAVLTAIVPTPSFYQYYAMPVSFLFLLLPYAYAASPDPTVPQKRLLFVLTAALLVFQAPAMLASIRDLANREAWVGLHVHDVAMDMRGELAARGTGAGGKVATLSPLYAVEANLPIYAELSTGPFLYRIGDMLTAEQR
ncbi:MAG: hypothetical protein VB089_10840, partial [Anaerolineaceae bacterium]|nr:hypothetical protein [Anaerolineaceae bacterium]